MAGAPRSGEAGKERVSRSRLCGAPDQQHGRLGGNGFVDGEDSGGEVLAGQGGALRAGVGEGSGAWVGGELGSVWVAGERRKEGKRGCTRRRVGWCGARAGPGLLLDWERAQGKARGGACDVVAVSVTFEIRETELSSDHTLTNAR